MTKIKFVGMQLFATQTTETSTLTAEMKTFYDKALIETASAALVHDQFGQKRPIPKNSGKTIEFRQFAKLNKALTALTEGVTPAGSELSVSTITATVSQYGDYVQTSDVLELTAIDNVILEATKALGNQAGATLDTITRNVLVAGTNVIYAPKSSGTAVTSRANLDATCVLTPEVVAQAATQLKAANAPTINGDYVAIIHPYVAKDLMRTDEWIDVHKYADPEAIYEGEIGKLYGVRFVETTEAKIWNATGDGTPTGLAVFGCIFLGDGAYGTTEVEGGGLETIVKQKGSAGTADPLDQRSTVGWKAIKTAAILVPDYIVRVECCSSYSSVAKAN